VRTRRVSKWWLIAPLIAAAVMLLSLCAVITLGAGLAYANGVLPRVSAGGVALGGLSQTAAADTLRSDWNTIILRDNLTNRTWTYNPAQLGIALDAQATAESAYAQGRSTGNALQAMLGGLDVAPIINIDLVTAAVTFDQLKPQIDLAPVNAGVALVDGRVQATPPRDGYALDVARLIGVFEEEGGDILADGVLELPMERVQPTVTDASPMIAQAEALLSRPLQLRAYDPITDESQVWTVNPQEWGNWLNATPDSASDTGLALTLDSSALATYFGSQIGVLGTNRTIDIDEAVAALQAAIESSRTDATLRIYHNDSAHTVQSGETLMTIAWDYGVPYPWIQQANPATGDTLTVGQTITIPSPDNFLEFPVVENKRIEVSIPEQRVRVYENGQLKWDWASSTGISSSPTWPGVYQVILHDENAYASNWDLYMPWFMGVYRPVPGGDFTNGFHGFPTRGGYQLIWTNSLGTRVTYGCILLSSDNARLLYDWAEEGVVVEIQG
jgi:lipoprotein-anchoring transpeptidase ErfK/SrfK